MQLCNMDVLTVSCISDKINVYVFLRCAMTDVDGLSVVVL